MKTYDEEIDKLVKVLLNQHQREALESFMANIGVINFANSSLVKVLNAGQYDKVPDELRKWELISGRQVPGLLCRREAEISMWNTP